MTNEEMLLQTLGTNEDAKTTLANILTEYFPSVVSELSLPDRIVEKFYDWQFPFIYTTDGAGTRKWSVSVRALCERNPKLADLDAFFNESGTEGTFKETYGGNDTETNTDNSARRTKTEFNGVDDPTSQSTSDIIVVEPVEGKNTTERKTEYGKTRTYADGRTWSQILADVMDTRGPVYLFINSFAQILREPAEDPCEMPVYPPSMQMKVKVNTIPAGDPSSASVTNQGTLYNAVFDVLFNIPQGEKGIAALMSTYTLTKKSDPNVNDQITITAENFSTYFSRDPVIDDRCIFVAKNTSTGESFILGVTCTTKNKNFAVFTVVAIVSTSQDLSNYAQIDGSYAGLGAGIFVGTQLQSGADVNDCIPTEFGKRQLWYNSSISYSFLNLPDGVAGTTFTIEAIKTWQLGGKYRVYQELRSISNNPSKENIFIRCRDMGGLSETDWTQWETITTSIGIYPTMGAGLDGDGNQISKTYARLTSPAFTGTPTAPTPATSDNSTNIATTAFVQSVFESSGRALYEHNIKFDVSEGASRVVAFFSIVSTIGEKAKSMNDFIRLFGLSISQIKEFPCTGWAITQPGENYPVRTLYHALMRVENDETGIIALCYSVPDNSIDQSDEAYSISNAMNTATSISYYDVRSINPSQASGGQSN